MSDSKRPRNINNVMLFRVLAIGYVLYMLFQVVKSYFEGGPDAPSIWVLLLSILVLGGGAVVIGIISWREYKKSVQETAEREAMEEGQAAESEEAETDYEEVESDYEEEETACEAEEVSQDDTL